MDESSITPDQSTKPEPAMPPKSEPKKKVATKPTQSFNLQSLTLPLLIAFLLISGYLVSQITAVKNSTNDLNSRLVKLEQPNKYAAGQVDSTKFQAVFLSNGQVFFGKITHIDTNTLTLEDIYYLKSGSFNKDGTAQGSLSLSKLGNEVHRPQDKMNIERRNVEFWENLKSDSQVTKVITNYEKAKKK